MAIVNSVAVKVGVQLYLDAPIPLSLATYLVVRFLNHTTFPFSFKRNLCSVFHEIPLFHISVNSVDEFFFPPLLFSILYYFALIYFVS